MAAATTAADGFTAATQREGGKEGGEKRRKAGQLEQRSPGMTRRGGGGEADGLATADRRKDVFPCRSTALIPRGTTTSSDGLHR